MRIREEERDGVLVVAPGGRLDSASSGDLETLLQERLEEGSSRMVVDFGGVDYISSAGLRVLLRLAKRMRESRGELALCAMAEPVRQVFDLAGFLPLFTVDGTREEALTRLGRSGHA